jgi:hypothetical protein
LGELGKVLVPFALFVFFLAMVMLSTHRFAWTFATPGFTFLALVSMALAFVFNLALTKVFTNEQDPALSYRLAFAMLIMAWGPFMAFHLANIPELDAILLHATEDSILSSIFNTIPISLMLVLQFAVIIFASACTAICFWRIRVSFTASNGKSKTWAWLFILALCALYMLIAIILILPGVNT